MNKPTKHYCSYRNCSNKGMKHHAKDMVKLTITGWVFLFCSNDCKALFRKLNAKSKKSGKCNDCGKAIYPDSARCAKCWAKYKSCSAKNTPRNTVINYLIKSEEFTLAHIGEAFGISTQNIWRIKKKYGKEKI